MVVAEEGVIQQADGRGLVAGAPHPEAAVAFLDWMAGAEAHEIVRAKLGRRSARRGVAPSPGLMDLAGLTLIQPDVEWITTQRDDILKRFEDARRARGAGPDRDAMSRPAIPGWRRRSR